MIQRCRFILVYLLLMGAGAYLGLHSDAPVPIEKALSELPMYRSQWRMVSQSSFSEQILALLKPTDYLYRTYSGTEGKNIGLYIGYHDGGKESGEIHSPKHCLPGSGWQELSSSRMVIATPGGAVNVVKAVYQKGEHKELFFYWFQVQGRTIANEYTLKLAEILNSLFHQRRDAAFVRISIPCDDDYERSMNTGAEFIRDFYPIIRNHFYL